MHQLAGQYDDRRRRYERAVADAVRALIAADEATPLRWRVAVANVLSDADIVAIVAAEPSVRMHGLAGIELPTDDEDRKRPATYLLKAILKWTAAGGSKLEPRTPSAETESTLAQIRRIGRQVAA
jgi:hypothetical protein